MVKDNPPMLGSTTVNGNPSPLGTLDTNVSDSNSDAISFNTSDSSSIGKIINPRGSIQTQQSQQPTSECNGSKRVRFKLQNRPAQLIRNLHASYFNRHLSEHSSGVTDSIVARVICSIRSHLFAFGAFASVAGCAILLGHGHPRQIWHGMGHFGLMIQLAYHGIFAATCTWQWFKRLTRSASGESNMNRAANFDGTNRNNENLANNSGAPESIHVLDSSLPENTIGASMEPPKSSQLADSTNTALPYCIFGYGLLGFLGLTPILAALPLSSLFWNPALVLASLSPLIIGPCLIGLDKISAAVSKDEACFSNELYDLQVRHENLMDENQLRQDILLETVGKEVQDAATLAIEALRQMTPNGLFPPSISREQLSPCTLPIPITSILGLFTTMRHLQYISRNMERLSRVMFTEYVQGIVEKTSPHYHRGENKFDVGEFVQSLGDLVSADASLRGVEFVIYHSEYALNHVSIKGMYYTHAAFLQLIKSIIDCAKDGSTVELCLALFTTPDSGEEKNRVTVSFEITYYPGPGSTSKGDDLAQLDALLASKLVRAMGGTLEIEQLEERVKRFIISVDVERSNEEKAVSHKNPDDQHRPIHPLEPSKEDESQTVVAQDHPVHESQQIPRSLLRTIAMSPSPPPSSPPPRRSGSSSSQKISAEPTIPELIRFTRKLAGHRVILMARDNSAFAARLSGHLKAWGIDVSQKTIRDSDSSSDGESSTTGEPQAAPGGAKRTNSSSSISGKQYSLSGKLEPPPTAKPPNPAFIMIDDDARTLGQQILQMRCNPPPPSPASVTESSKRPTHKRNKSTTSIQHTSIIYFTSLPTFKQARDTITFILGPQTPGSNYTIANSLSGNALGNGSLALPYILVLPKPAGPRRVLTALHTVISVPTLDQSYSPIATAPTSPAPPIRHFSEEINPLDRDQVVYDPVSNQAFARAVPNSTQSSPGGVSPNNVLPQDQRQRRDMMRQMIEAEGKIGRVVYPFDGSITEVMSPETLTSSSVGSPTGIIMPGTSGQPAGIHFDPTAKPSGSYFAGTHRRVSNGGGRPMSQSLSTGEGGAVIIRPSINHQPFAVMHAQRSSENGTPNLPRFSNGQHLRSSTVRSPLGTPPAITQSNGLLFLPPTARHSVMASPLPQRPDPVAMRNGNGIGGPLGNIGLDSPKLTHPVLPHGSLASSPMPFYGLPSIHASSPPPADAVPSRSRTLYPVKKSKEKDVRATKSFPSLIKSGVVERVSPLVNVLIVEDNLINLQILVKFMRQRKIRYETARNGREAVDRWRVGGFHLVLMDIQMPVMDGIEATREIRRLERAQKIGVFPTDRPNSVGSSPSTSTSPSPSNVLISTSSPPSDALISTTSSPSGPSTSTTSTPASPLASQFRSPVIIVALTASAESEDLRKTALLAGCNDYITKPVELPWLERKIVDWGCMQALIDVDAWREWKKDIEGTSPGSPSAGQSSSSTPTAKKLLASASVTRTSLKRPSISPRSIRGIKAAAAAKNAAAAAAAATEEKDKKDGKATTAEGSTSSPSAVPEITAAKRGEEAERSQTLGSKFLPTIPETTVNHQQHSPTSSDATVDAVNDSSPTSST
ncbi:ssk1 response regulator receiver [Mortierella sp. AD011]|nr:ssk1 response regulator receiver [Mortierella sp. AD010]KAF9386405.1 ssk1 response regulator receiver [Mortierella sp. AD011]